VLYEDHSLEVPEISESHYKTAFWKSKRQVEEKKGIKKGAGSVCFAKLIQLFCLLEAPKAKTSYELFYNGSPRTSTPTILRCNKLKIENGKWKINSFKQSNSSIIVGRGLAPADRSIVLVCSFVSAGASPRPTVYHRREIKPYKNSPSATERRAKSV